MIAAVADGAGSASRAEDGASLAVDEAVSHLLRRVAQTDRLSKQDVEIAARAARAAIEAQASAQGAIVRDFACTLLLLALSDTGGVALQIGDGLIAVNQGQDGWEWVFWPQRGEFANTTFFITDENAPDQWEATDLAPYVFEFALMSDGLEVLALDYGAKLAHTPFFEGLLPALRKQTESGEINALSDQLYTHFLMSDRVRRRADDDLSLVICARDAPAGQSP